MTTRTNRADTVDIARMGLLAELRIGPEEAARLTLEVEAILAYVAELDAVDTEGVPPTTSVLPLQGGEDAWRVDEVVPGLSHDDALREAPRSEHEGFSVPTFVES